MKRIIIESPYAGDVEANEAYLRRCLRFALLQGCAPFASHGLYTLPGVLDDLDPAERRMGIEAGFAWRPAADETWFFLDLGVSDGMREGFASSTPGMARRVTQARVVFVWLERDPLVLHKPSMAAGMFDGRGAWAHTVRAIEAGEDPERPSCESCASYPTSMWCIDCMYHVPKGAEDHWRCRV